MLELQHISWTAPGGNQVLRDVSLTIPEGKLTVITGPNGGGKTTLAKIIAGLERQLAAELRHSPVHRDASHVGSFSILVHSALF